MSAKRFDERFDHGTTAMRSARRIETHRSLCWVPLWHATRPGLGLEHVLVSSGRADSVLLAIDEDDAPFRLSYQLRWNARGLLRRAELKVRKGSAVRYLFLRVDHFGTWRGKDGEHLARLDGCVDIDIWPTPLTNSFPIWRSRMRIGERREFKMAWVSAPDLTVEPKAQAYTRLDDRRYLFESLDGTGFEAVLPVDDDGFVLDYPDLFSRVPERGDA
ncbi:MAG: putative glycolipid-binding domain-containing protein [Lautropia sp.]